FVHAHIHPETAVFNAVGGIMLDTGHHVMFLDTPGQGGAHLPQEMRVFAVGFLGPAPGRVAQEVDTYPAEVVTVVGADLPPNGFTDLRLQFRIPAGSPGHGHWETGGMAADHAAGADAELDRPEPKPPGTTGDPRVVVVLVTIELKAEHIFVAPRHKTDLLSQCQAGEDLLCHPVNLLSAHPRVQTDFSRFFQFQSIPLLPVCWLLLCCWLFLRGGIIL